MQPHERVVLQPVAAHPVTPVHQRDAHVRRMVDEGVGESHPHRAAADHQIVDIDLAGHALGPGSITPAISVCEDCRRAWAVPADATVLGERRVVSMKFWPVPVTARW